MKVYIFMGDPRFNGYMTKLCKPFLWVNTMILAI